MSADISLKEIERKAYRSTFEDGLWDIQLGLLLLGIGCAPLLESLGLMSPLNILPVVIIPILTLHYGKKMITVPRMGVVKFGSKRKSDRKKLRFISIILFVLTLTQVILTIAGVFPPKWMMDMGIYAVPMIIAFFAVLVFSLFAYYRDFPRLVWIGFMFGGGILLSEYLYHRIGQPYDGVFGCGIPAVIVIGYGATLLFRFLKNYPLPVEAEVPNGSQ